MILSRTPFRLSFFGGGTDYPSWYRTRGGTVLGATINKYCYLSCRYLPPFFEHRIRIVYSKIENCQTVNEIQHPAVRECLRYLQIGDGLEIHHDGDLPARGGIGSSSAFTVGLLHALHTLRGRAVSKHELALQAIHLEQDLLSEAVGSQDQVLTCYGGLNRVEFQTHGDFIVSPVFLEREALEDFTDHFLLFFTGLQRNASDIAKTYSNRLFEKEREMLAISQMVQAGLDALKRADYAYFGGLLHEYWKLKRALSPRISHPSIDRLYGEAISAGALGGKLVGAGGGGYLMLFAPPTRHSNILQRLSALLHIPFRFESAGSQIIDFDPDHQP